MKRRTILQGGVAAAAGLAGAGLAWWRFQPHAVGEQAQVDFWASRFEGPNQEVVELSAFRGRPLLVNFWATWCPPCVEELPLLNRFYREQLDTGWQVLGLAVDQVPAVRRFMERLPLAFPVGMAGMAGTELSRRLGNANGGLPFSVGFGADGAVLHRKIGQLSSDDLSAWARG